MLIFVMMAAQVLDEMALRILIFTLGKILQNFFSKIDGNSRGSPQCEKTRMFFIYLFEPYIVIKPCQYQLRSS